MHSAKRLRLASAVLLAGASIGAYVAVTAATADAGTHRAQAPRHHADGRHHANGRHHGDKPGPSITRFNLDGYVIDAKYTLGRNTGNTFEQTYTAQTVQGVPIKGPFVGTTFPPEDYVAIPIGHHQLYVTWIDPTQNDALVDVFVMNFKTHVVYDYAPGSLTPESSGFITVRKRGAQPLP
jgi:predicted acylesterase/phospholipase RssA